MTSAASDPTSANAASTRVATPSAAGVWERLHRPVLDELSDTALLD